MTAQMKKDHSNLMRPWLWLGVVMLALIIAIFSGCKSTSFSRTTPDGAVTKVRDMRFLTQTAANVDASVNTNGTWQIKASVQSSPQAEAIKAAAEGVAEGIARGMNPAPK